ncbi:integral membrane protein [Hirsutella rhossiliensis]|uniref:Integral membrane protein n=1 Tax=Hirsutella rhossiliensis TaxID=111463 RepID=A0A9P8SM53_9HYPO|nr:uncharacterized protein HRG_03842 [Hirsutella rhossiliensis]KAH0965826.1 integral membrane protein [Hirsutella rhossiliensis]
MSLYTDPPALLPFRHDKPTLLVCWWATSFCALMILIRITGRFIRTERLFREDKIAACALVPLVLRMACVHFILVWGTSNADFTGVDLTPAQLRQKSIASGLTIASRFFYTSTLWIYKYAILEFLTRLTDLTWERSHRSTLFAIRWTLVITFVATLITNLAECRPFHLHWQVLPDPGGQCRQGYAQLITMATCNVATDILLVVFPVPLIVRSRMRFRRKAQLILLFSLSLSVVALTIYRLPHILREHGRQQARSLLASVEIIFATASANALVLGSFVRDRGIKKQKFHRPSVAESFDPAASTRLPTLRRQWGSDEDLVRDVGLGADPSLRDPPGSPGSEPLSPMSPRSPNPMALRLGNEGGAAWLEHHGPGTHQQPPPPAGPRRLSFLDVGGLLDDPEAARTATDSGPSRATNPPPASVQAGTAGVQRGSTALLQDLAGNPGPRNGNVPKPKPGTGTQLQSIPQSRPVQRYDGRRDSGPQLMDPGGLLK